MNSRTRSVTAVHVETSASDISSVVSSTSRMLRPSTPTKYSTRKPAAWNQVARSESCNPGFAGSKAANIASDTAKTASEVNRAIQRISVVRRPGTTSNRKTPASGRKMRAVKIGKVGCIGVPRSLSEGGCR